MTGRKEPSAGKSDAEYVVTSEYRWLSDSLNPGLVPAKQFALFPLIKTADSPLISCLSLLSIPDQLIFLFPALLLFLSRMQLSEAIVPSFFASLFPLKKKKKGFWHLQLTSLNVEINYCSCEQKRGLKATGLKRQKRFCLFNFVPLCDMPYERPSE